MYSLVSIFRFISVGRRPTLGMTWSAYVLHWVSLEGESKKNYGKLAWERETMGTVIVLMQ
jgi:hypothetical protein